MYSSIFNVGTNANACDYTRVCADTVRVCTETNLTLREKSLAASGNGTCVSDVPVQRSTN